MRLIMLRNLTFLLLLSPLLFTACSDDDSDAMAPDTADEVVLDGTSFTLTKGFVESIGGNAGQSTFDFDFHLTDEGIVQNVFTGFAGNGNYVYLDLNCDCPGESPSTGTYTYNTTGERTAFSIVSAYAILDDAVAFGTGINDFTATGGTVEVERFGDEYVLTLNLTDAAGETLTGEFGGAFTDL